MSERVLREELDKTVERVLKKLDRKTFVDSFPQVGSLLCFLSRMTNWSLGELLLTMTADCNCIL